METPVLSFDELLSVRPPMVALIEADHRYARSLLASARQKMQIRAGQSLEWTGARGWHGAIELLGRLGLERRGAGDPDPSLSFAELTSALVSSRERATGREGLLRGGVVELHDLYPHLEKPSVIQALAELSEAVALIDTVAVVVLPEPLRPGHPLHSALISYHSTSSPQERYGPIVSKMLAHMQMENSEEQLLPLCGALQGLPLVAADFVLRLVLSDAVRRTGKGSLLDRVRRARAKYEVVSRAEKPEPTRKG